MVHHKYNSILAWLGLIFANTFHSNPPVPLDPLHIKRPISNHRTVRFNESTETEPASSQLKPSIHESPLWNAFFTAKPRILQLGCASMSWSVVRTKAMAVAIKAPLLLLRQSSHMNTIIRVLGSICLIWTFETKNIKKNSGVLASLQTIGIKYPTSHPFDHYSNKRKVKHSLQRKVTMSESSNHQSPLQLTDYYRDIRT